MDMGGLLEIGDRWSSSVVGGDLARRAGVAAGAQGTTSLRFVAGSRGTRAEIGGKQRLMIDSRPGATAMQVILLTTVAFVTLAGCTSRERGWTPPD
jgi:hypothetical protein